MPPTVRPALPADRPTIVEFNRRLALESEGKVLDPSVLDRGVAAAIEDPRKGRYFVAADGDTMVGQVLLTTEWSDWRDGWTWWFQSVYVVAEARGTGVFRALYAHVLREAAASPDPVVAVRLYVERGNAVARQVYHKVGMTDSGYLVYEKSLPGSTG